MRNLSFLDFIQQNALEDTQRLRLSCKKNDYNFDIDHAITQIECRRKYQQKFSKILTDPLFIFPDSISAEQASHQSVAKYHASLLYDFSNILDMTGGLGIDSLAFANSGNNVTTLEIDSYKAEVLKKNVENIRLKNLRVITDDSIHFLSNCDDRYDAIFIDPSRRGSDNKRLYNLHDCSPDVLKNIDLLLSKSDNIFIKASPLLDLSQTLKDFDKIVSITVIGVKEEVKEIFIHLSSCLKCQAPNIKGVNLDNNGEVIYEFKKKKETKKIINYASLEDLKKGAYILEPSPIIMKIAPWEDISLAWDAKKFSVSSHLFVTNKVPENFPGRVTEFNRFITKKDRKSLVGLPASVVSKNYPLSSVEIRHDLKLKEGDNQFIYASRIGDKTIMLLSDNIL